MRTLRRFLVLPALLAFGFISFTCIVFAQSPELPSPPRAGTAATADGGVETFAASDVGIPAVGSHPFEIFDDANLEEVQPSVAYNTARGQYLTVWSNDRPGNDDIRAQRNRTDGSLIGTAFYVSAGSGAERRYPDIAYGSKPDVYLVVWEHDDGTYVSIHGRLVSSTGQPLDSEFPISSGAALKNCFKPAVSYAYTSDTFLVVWQRNVVASLTADIEVQLISASGTPIGPSLFIAQGTLSFSHSDPDVAYNRRRNEYLVVWEREDRSDGLTDITSRRVRGTGELLFPESVDLIRVTISNTDPSVAAIPTATANGQFLAVWEIHQTATDTDIYGRIVNGDGSAGTQVYIASAAENEKVPVVAGSEIAQRYVVTWLKDSAPPLAFTGVRARTIATDGKVVGPDQAIGGSFSDRSAVAAGPVGDFLVTFDDNPLTGNKGVFGRLMGRRTYVPELAQ